MKHLLFILTLVLLTLTSCGSLKTTLVENYEWDGEEDEYISTSFVRNVDAKFKLKPFNDKLKFKVGAQKNYIELVDVELDQSKIDTKVEVFDGYLNGREFCRLVYYPDLEIIIIFGNNENGRYQSNVVFANPLK